MLTKPRSLWQVSLSLTPKQKIILSLLAAVLCTNPLWLGLQGVHSASSSVASPIPPAPTSNVTLTDVPAEALIGEQVKFKVTFKNPGNAIGYGPFIDLVLDAGGANLTKPPHIPPCFCDGITFVKAEIISVNGGPIDVTPPLSSQIMTSPCGSVSSTSVVHAFAASGIQPVTLPTGAQLVTIALPFGSYNPTPPQPNIVVEVTAKVSNLADYNVPLKISARSGFRYGTDPLDNAFVAPFDLPILSDPLPNSATWSAQAQTIPTVMIIKKEYSGPEDETATGPNYPRTYKITVDIANGQSIANLKVHDFLPNNMQYQDGVVVKIGSSLATQGSFCTNDYTLTKEPPTSAPQVTPTNELEVSFCHPIIGTALPDDVTVTFTFFIPEFDASLINPVLQPNCTPALSINAIRAEGDWVPLDPCDNTPVHVTNNVTVAHTLSDKCLAIQKSVTMANDTGASGPTPGDILRYQLNFQISDFKTIGNIEIRDILSDGQRLLLAPAFLRPTLTVADKSAPAGLMGNFVLGPALSRQLSPFVQCQGIMGGTAITFRVSTRMATPPFAPTYSAGILTGGLASVTPPNNVPAIGQIVFYARITDQFVFPHPPGDKFVDKDDPLNNCVTIRGRVFTNVNPPAMPSPTAVIAQDDSKTATAIVTDTIKKTVYAIKRGTTLVCGPAPAPRVCSNSPSPPEEVRPGDQVTFRIEKTIPSSDAEKLTIQDFLPLPVFDVNDPYANGTPPSWPAIVAATCPPIPSPGQACELAPSNTLNLPFRPALTPDSATNSITFNYGSFNSTTNQPRRIDLLFTATVTNKPFADGLFLTNEAQECESNTFGVRFCQAAIAQVKVGEPSLRIRKGVIATDNPNGQFSQPVPGPTPSPTPTIATAQAPAGVTFSLTGVSGLVNSNALLTGLIDSNLSNVDANDLVTFAITIENVGGAPAYDAKLEEKLPACFTNLSHIVVKRGTGAVANPLLYTLVTSASGFTITSNLGAPINAYHATNGSNIIVITFQAQLRPDVSPGCCDNVAELQRYASTPGGPDFVAAGFTPPFDDSAQVCVNPTLTKSVVATSEVHTAPQISATPQTAANTPPVAIGEIVRYRLVVRVPEGGLLPTFLVTDALPAGMKFLNDGSARLAFISNGPGITHPFAPVSSPAFNVSGNESTLLLLTFSSLQPVPAAAISGGAACGAPVTFNLGNIQNNDNDPDLEYIVIELNALVCNVASNQNGATLPNTFSVSVNGTQIATSNPIDVLVVEPNLTMTKTVAPNPAIKGQTLTYTVQYTNSGTADAFDVELKDTLPPGFTFGTITAGCPFTTVPANTITMTCSQVPKAPNPGSTVVVTYQAVANPETCPVTLQNRASLTWTSLPGPQGTTGNPSGSSTPGNSGAVDGERNGVTPPLALNDYAATASAAVKIDCPCNATITGSKFNDLNGNGVRDPGEPGLAGWTITVTDSNGNTQTVTTDSQGNYSITVAAPGTYTVSEVLQSPWTQTAPMSGTYSVTVSPGQVINNRDFGNKTGPCATPPPQGMVAWWPLDEPNGATIVNDLALFNNQGVPKPGGQVGISGPAPVTGEVQGALYFTGPYVEVPPQAELDFGSGNFSIDAWVRPVDCSHGGGGVLSPIVDKFNGTSGFSFYLDQPTVGAAHLYLNINGSTFVSSGINGTIPTLGPATWSHVAVTVTRPPSGSAVVTFYINGSATGTFTPPTGPTGSVTNTVPLWIGKTRIAGGVCETAIDELELFNRALLPGEIQSIADAKSAGKCKCLLVSNEKITCNSNGTFNYTFTLTNLSSSTASGVIFSPLSDVTITPASMTIPPLASGAPPTNVTVTIGGPGAVSGANVCFFVGLARSIFTNGLVCRIEHCITLPTCQSSSCATPPRGMVAWWPMDLQNGLVNDVAPPPDSLVNNWGASPANQPVFGNVGGASGALFFGAPALQVSPQSELDFGTGDFSIDAWVRIVSVAPGVISPIVDKFTTPGGPGFAFYMRNQKLELNVNGSTFVSTAPNLSFADPVANTGPWYHVAVTVQRSPAQAIFYINGFSAGISTAVPASSVNNGLPLLIGGTRLLPGTVRGGIAIDELELFNRVLTQAQIQSIVNAGSAGKCP